jgi:putative transposase
MSQIDEPSGAWSFFGSRHMARTLCTAGVPVNRKRVRRLTRLMAITAKEPKPGTGQPTPDDTICSCLLRTGTIERANHIWAANSAYIPIDRGALSRGDLRLGEPRGAGAAVIEHDGRFILSGAA